jgi:hypothetical protein
MNGIHEVVGSIPISSTIIRPVAIIRNFFLFQKISRPGLNPAGSLTSLRKRCGKRCTP